MTTAFFWDERCFWHHGGQYALTLPVGGLVQPGAGLPDTPETKRRFLNLLNVSGMARHLALQGAAPATRTDLLRVHPAAYLDRFQVLSDGGGGEIGPRAPFGQGGYEIAALSAGLAKAALGAVLRGEAANAYALCRPPGHHCLPEQPMGFCLLANIAVAVKAARADQIATRAAAPDDTTSPSAAGGRSERDPGSGADPGKALRIAIVDWDVHHGNGTEAIFYTCPDTLTISLHQERNFPLDTGSADARGSGDGLGTNINVPLPPGTGHTGFLKAWDRIVEPALHAFRPDAIVIACGFDAAALDPLSATMATAETFGQLTARARAAAEALCGGRLALIHEGGYSEAYVPFCGHAAIEALTDAPVRAPDPLADTLHARQPGPRFDAMLDATLDEIEAVLARPPG